MQIAIGLFQAFTALDAIGPYQVFTQLPDAEVVLCASEKGAVVDDNGLLSLNISHTFDEVDSPDIIVVPGGFITRRLARDGHPIVDWAARVHPQTTYTTSVCTGALLLGAAGLLDGLDATTHWTAYEALAKHGAMPTEQRVVGRGKIWTAAGVSAGIDLALTVVAETHGADVAKAIQLAIEYDPQPPYDSGAPSKASPEIVDLVRSISAGKQAGVLAAD
jgi:transcriptional regulator GlxA family with amidase domain